MSWRCTTFEDLDDDHATAVAWTSWLAVIDDGSGRLTVRFGNAAQHTRVPCCRRKRLYRP